MAHFPTGGEIVLFDRSWYNRGMVEPVFGFCTDQEYSLFMRGVVGFEKDLVRQGTILIIMAVGAYFLYGRELFQRPFLAIAVVIAWLGALVGISIGGDTGRA